MKTRTILTALLAAMLFGGMCADADAQRRRATSEVDAGATRSTVCTNLSEAQFQQMAEQLTNEVFTDETFIELSAVDRPRMVIGDIENLSHSYQLEVDMMFNVFRNILVSSRAVRLYARGADDIDLILAGDLTSTYLRAAGSPTDVSFTLHLTLTRPDGEFLGAWQNTRAFVC